MREPLYVEIVPGPLATRLFVADGATTLLKARLPHSPHHPRAVCTVAEALTLWTSRPCHVALAADGGGAFCATARWLDTRARVTQPVRVTVACVHHDAVPADPAPGDGLGAFADVHRLLRRRPAP